MMETRTNKNCKEEGCHGQLIVVVKREAAWVQCDTCEAKHGEVEMKSVR